MTWKPAVYMTAPDKAFCRGSKLCLCEEIMQLDVSRACNQPSADLQQVQGASVSIRCQSRHCLGPHCHIEPAHDHWKLEQLHCAESLLESNALSPPSELPINALKHYVKGVLIEPILDLRQHTAADGRRDHCQQGQQPMQRSLLEQR